MYGEISGLCVRHREERVHEHVHFPTVLRV